MSDPVPPGDGLPRVIGHDGVLRWLRDGAARSMAFVGPDAVGRRTVARWWAAWANCDASGDRPCGTCASCRAAALGAHPDLMIKEPAATTRKGRASMRRLVRLDQLVFRENGDPEPLSLWLERRPPFRVRVGV
ncbi:MAG: hypothetical protein WD336_07090, partial [Trueperaceae bacterium]